MTNNATLTDARRIARRRWAGAARTLLVLMLASVLALPAAPRARGEAPQVIRIAVVKATVLAPALLIAKHLPPGWKTELIPFTVPSDMTNALLTNSVDLAYIGFTVAVVARSKGQPIVVVANQAEKGTAIVVRANSSIRTIADLKGKRVGDMPTAIHDILLREELKKANMRPEDLQLIRLAPADMPGALQRGDIDAFAGNEPNSTETVMAGYGRVIMYPYDNPVGGINVGVLTTEREVKERAEMLHIWAAAHARATDELAKNPDAWAKLVHQEWGYDQAATLRSIDNIELRWQMDKTFMSQFAEFMARLKDLGVITQIPDENKLIVPDFIASVKPE